VMNPSVVSSVVAKCDMNSPNIRGNAMAIESELKEWLAIRKKAGLKINPETAEVDWCYAQTLDPYGVYPELPEECQQVGREYFARSPGSDIWVHLDDQMPTFVYVFSHRASPSRLVTQRSVRHLWKCEVRRYAFETTVKVVPVQRQTLTPRIRKPLRNANRVVSRWLK
jgi:hypothetical protein